MSKYAGKTLKELQGRELGLTECIDRIKNDPTLAHLLNWSLAERAKTREYITKLKKNEPKKYAKVGATQKRIEAFTRKCLRDLVAQLPDDQRSFFTKLYPEGIDKLALSKVPWAIEQCERTIAKNLYR